MDNKEALELFERLGKMPSAKRRGFIYKLVAEHFHKHVVKEIRKLGNGGVATRQLIERAVMYLTLDRADYNDTVFMSLHVAYYAENTEDHFHRISNPGFTAKQVRSSKGYITKIKKQLIDSMEALD